MGRVFLLRRKCLGLTFQSGCSDQAIYGPSTFSTEGQSMPCSSRQRPGHRTGTQPASIHKAAMGDVGQRRAKIAFRSQAQLDRPPLKQVYTNHQLPWPQDITTPNPKPRQENYFPATAATAVKHLQPKRSQPRWSLGSPMWV